MVRHPATLTTSETTASAFSDVTATMATSACPHPVAVTMKCEEAASSVPEVKTTTTSVGGEWKDEETILQCKETKVCGVHLTQRCEA
jgi:hypothetical protein